MYILQPAWPAQQVSFIACLPTCVPVILPDFNSFFAQVCPTVRPHLSNADRGSRKGGATEIGKKSLQVHCCNSPPTHCYFTHACSIIFYIYVVVTSLCCQGVWSSEGVLSRGAVKRCCQGVVSSGVVKWYCQGVVSSAWCRLA